MPTVHRARSVFAGLGLAAALLLSTAGPAAAGAGETPQAAWATNGTLRLLADWLLGLWAAGTEGFDVRGCIADPNGGCVGGTTPPLEGVDAGCTADPNGGSCGG